MGNAIFSWRGRRSLKITLTVPLIPKWPFIWIGAILNICHVIYPLHFFTRAMVNVLCKETKRNFPTNMMYTAVSRNFPTNLICNAVSGRPVNKCKLYCSFKELPQIWCVLQFQETSTNIMCTAVSGRDFHKYNVYCSFKELP